MPYVYEKPKPRWVYTYANRGDQALVYTVEEVQEMNDHRCSEQGHEYEMGCSIFLELSQICRWCGAMKGVHE